MKRTHRRRLLALIAAVCVLGSLTSGAAQARKPDEIDVVGDSVLLPVHGAQVRVDTTTLRVTARLDGRTLELSAPTPKPLGTVESVVAHDGQASWSYPARGLTVSAEATDGRLLMRVHSDRDGTMTWPVTGTDPATTSIQFPRGEGLSVPVDDPWWNSEAAKLAGSSAKLVGGLTMPFWGYTLGERGVSYIVPTDVGTSLTFVSRHGRLHTETVHTFSGREHTRDYTIAFALTGPSPVASARDYRDWLIDHRGLRTLEEKIAANPEVGKLIGAFHAYTWGRARTAAGIRRMRELGLSRMWLGYDSSDDPMPRAAVEMAKKAGYLVAPYDSWANAQPPESADNPSSRWPAPVWPKACIHDKQGEIMTGFGGRGCYLSSQALAQAEPSEHYLANRVAKMTANGVNSYFLDVDAAGQLHSDHTPAHPMTKKQDRRNRLARMRWLSAEKGLVLGSESAGSWASDVLAYSHGSLTPTSPHLWKLENDREFWGGYWPPESPDFFFQPVHLPDDAAKAMFDPTYRVPLYQTVLHDSVISLDRWELSYYKLPDQTTTRALLAMLYNTPLNFVLGGEELDEHGAEIAKLQQYFAPLHKAAATKPMTDFRWLTDDHLVQRTTFGHEILTVTANFSDHPYGSLPGGCVTATVRGDPTPHRLCPANL